MATLQQQARALGDPTRHRIFTFITEATGPVGISEINAEFPFNHNAIRQHLAKLVGAGLVAEKRESAGRPGRPRLVYEMASDVDSCWGLVGPYQRRSLLLAAIVETGDAPVDVGPRAGREMGAALPLPVEGAEKLTVAMAKQGFEPELRRTPRTAEIVLHNCPFEPAALAHRETVCTLHLGMAEGLADGTDVTVAELVAKDPRRANCRIRLRRSGD